MRVVYLAAAVAATTGGALKAQALRLPFVPHADTAPRGRWYDPIEGAIGWADSGRTLVFTHHVIYSAGTDVVETNCKESGIFALDTQHHTVRRIHAPVVHVPPHSDQCTEADGAVRLSPDGQSLLFGWSTLDSGSSVYRLDLATSQLSTIGPRCGYRVASPRLSPDGKMIATSWGCGHPRGATLLLLMRSNGDDPHPLSPGDTAGADEPTWGPDGTRLAYTRNDGTAGEQGVHVAVIDTNGANQRELAPGQGPVWSPSGEWIAYVTEETQPRYRATIRLVRPAGTDDHAVFVDSDTTTMTNGWTRFAEGQPWEPLLWSPDGRWLIFSRIYTRGTLLWRVNIETGAVEQLTSISGQTVSGTP